MKQHIIPTFFDTYQNLNKQDAGIVNNDTALLKDVERAMQHRHDLKLDGLIGDLQAIIINTECQDLENAASELMSRTGLDFHQAFEDKDFSTIVFKKQGCADFLIRCRKTTINPFKNINIAPSTKHKPNARLETFIFKTNNIEKYVAIQKKRGVQFQIKNIMETNKFYYIQTIPSSFTGNAFGFIQWKSTPGDYFYVNAKTLNLNIQKPDHAYLQNIMELDHIATRLHAKDRDAAIIEYMELTNYNFEFAIYVKQLNSITNVARLRGATFSQVFTTGISEFQNDDEFGPTEKFVQNYGTRVHHMAFRTENIERVFEELKKDGQEFLLELVGSEGEGLKQTFTKPSPFTFLVNEYIHRFGDFDGFFTKSNVTLLTEASGNQ